VDPVKGISKAQEFVSQSIRRVAVVMQVDLHVAKPTLTQIRDWLQVLGKILILWIKKGVLWGTATRILESLQLRVVAHPPLNALHLHSCRRPTPHRFVVVSDANENVLRRFKERCPASGQRSELSHC
jgi:hypothetical protein